MIGALYLGQYGLLTSVEIDTTTTVVLTSAQSLLVMRSRKKKT